jgi:hypothetical protein
MLSVTGLNGHMKALYGAFEPAQKTQGGCQCSQLWSYTDSSGGTVYVKGQCVNPDGAQAKPWCQYEPESCTGSELAAGRLGVLVVISWQRWDWDAGPHRRMPCAVEHCRSSSALKAFTCSAVVMLCQHCGDALQGKCNLCMLLNRCDLAGLNRQETPNFFYAHDVL